MSSVEIIIAIIAVLAVIAVLGVRSSKPTVTQIERTRAEREKEIGDRDDA